MPRASLFALLGALGAALGLEAQLPAQQEARVACEDPSACAGKSGNQQGVLLVQVRRDRVAKSATGVTGNSTGTVSLSEEVDWPKDGGKKDGGKKDDGKKDDGKKDDGKKDDGKKDGGKKGDGKKDGKSGESKGSAGEKSWKGKGETGKGETGAKGGVDEKAVKGKEEPGKDGMKGKGEPGKDGMKGKGEPGKDGKYTTSSPSEMPAKGAGKDGGKHTTSSPSEMPAKGAGKEEKGAEHSSSGKSWKEKKGYADGADGAEESEIKALLGTKMWKMYQDLANRTVKTQIMLAKLDGKVQQLSSCCDSSTDGGTTTTTSSSSEMPAKGAGKEEKGAAHSSSGKSGKEKKGGYADYADGAEESEIKALLGTKMWKMYQDLANGTVKTQIMLAKLKGKVQQLSSCCDSSADKDGKAHAVPTTSRLNGPVSGGGAPTTTTTLSAEGRSGEPGLCAVFGDPHFITFDGGHTVLVGERVIWLVKTESVWIQGASLGAEGKFAALAVGGTFMKGHTLLLFNNSETGKIHTAFDGECVLNNTVDEYHVEGVLDAYREDKWDAQVFNDRILSMRTEAKFEIGAWHERFLGKPRGGLYVLKLPGGVEVTVTGVDFLSAVITMPRPSGDSEGHEQGGYCGNFNGDPEDDADPVVPSWNTPLGKDLDPVDPALNLFLSKRAPALFQMKGNPAKADKAEARQTGGNLLPLLDALAACPKELREQADATCANLEDARLQHDCIFDVCLTGNAQVADEMLAADILEEEVNAHGIPVFMGHGRCADTAGRPFDALTTTLRTEKECQELLRALALSEGVLGAQLHRTSTCEVLVSAEADPTNVVIPGGWGEKRGAGSAGQGLIRGIVQEGVMGEEGVEDDTASWSCWKLV